MGILDNARAGTTTTSPLLAELNQGQRDLLEHREALMIAIASELHHTILAERLCCCPWAVKRTSDEVASNP